jgi:intracellular septation protein A
MAMKNTVVFLAFSLSLAGGTLVAQKDPVQSLMSKDLAGGREKSS